MKHLMIAGALLLLLPTAVGAQDFRLGRFELTFGGGINFPQGEFGEGFDNGYLVNAGLGYRLTPRLLVGTELAWHGHEGEGTFGAQSITVDSGITQ